MTASPQPARQPAKPPAKQDRTTMALLLVAALVLSRFPLDSVRLSATCSRRPVGGTPEPLFQGSSVPTRFICSAIGAS